MSETRAEQQQQDQGSTSKSEPAAPNQPREPKPKRASRSRRKAHVVEPGVPIHDPALYAELSRPFATNEEASAALADFFAAVRVCRIRYRIADVVTVACVKEPQATVVSYGQNGDSAKTALMLAWALGREEAAEHQRVEAMRQSGRASTPTERPTP